MLPPSHELTPLEYRTKAQGRPIPDNVKEQNCAEKGLVCWPAHLGGPALAWPHQNMSKSVERGSIQGRAEGYTLPQVFDAVAEGEPALLSVQQKDA